MTYNMMFYRTSSAPCSHSQGTAARDADFQTIFNFVKPNILAINEIGSGAGVASFFLNNVVNVNGSVNYDKANSAFNSSSLANLLIFDSTKVGLAFAGCD